MESLEPRLLMARSFLDLEAANDTFPGQAVEHFAPAETGVVDSRSSGARITDGDSDFYRFRAAGDGEMRVVLAHQGGNPADDDTLSDDLQMQFLDAAGLPVGAPIVVAASGRTASHVLGSVQGGDEFFLVVQGVSPDDDANYRLDFINLDRYDDGGTNNNALAVATPLGTLGSIDQANHRGLTIHQPDRDYFRFDVSPMSPGSLTVALQMPAGSGASSGANGPTNLGLRVRDSRGVAIATSTGTGDFETARIDVPLSAAVQTYYLEVYAASSTQVNRYDLALDFQPVFQGHLSGTKFEDLNGDGLRDEDEPSLAGVVMQLDWNSDGTIDRTDETDADGYYEFVGVPNGRHKVTELTGSDTIQTLPGFGLGFAYEVVVGPENFVWENLDFGNATPVAIHGYKFHDLDLDGIDDDEPRLAGVRFELIGDANADGLIDHLHASTDAQGEFWFTDLVPGSYVVREEPNPNLLTTTPTEVAVTLFSGDVAVALAGQVILPPTQAEIVVPELAFGNFVLSEIRGYKFVDGNASGSDNFEPRLAGVTIDLWGPAEDENGDDFITPTDGLIMFNDNPPVATDVTDADGNYSFKGLLPGLYVVDERLPPGSISTTRRPVMLFVGNGEVHLAPLSPPPAPFQVPVVNIDLAFGNLLRSSIHGQKFEDRNGNGFKEPGEPGLAGWTIAYSGTDLFGDPVAGSTVTMADDPNTPEDETGMYWIDGLLPGDYIVSEVQQDGWRQSFPNLSSLAGPILPQPAPTWLPTPTPAGTGGVSTANDHIIHPDVGEILTKIVTVDDPANHIVPTGVGYDGVVLLELDWGPFGGFLCSGALLPTGRHILTAGHCVSGFGRVDAIDALAHFDLPGGLVSVPSSSIFVHPQWNGDVLAGGDMAIIELAFAAPPEADRYDIYRGSDEVGQDYVKVGYGTTGTGDTGGIVFDGIKRIGENTYDAFADVFEVFFGPDSIAPRTQLAFDFDNGLPENDAFGTFFPALAHLGLGVREANSAPGDSGGPNFIDGKIAGVTSYGFGFAGPPDVTPNATDSSFGEMSVDTRVSDKQDWFDHVLFGAPLPHRVRLGSGQVLEGRDFGNFRPGDIHGVKFDDRDGNGAQDAGEPNLADWTIVLEGVDGFGRPVQQVTSTMADDPNTPEDETGAYWFGDLHPGVYEIREVQQPGWQQTAPGLSIGLAVLQFDEVPFQPVDGLTVQGVTFDFKVFGNDSLDAFYNAAGPGQSVFLQDPSLVGDTYGILTLEFAHPTPFLAFGVGISELGEGVSIATVELFDGDGQSLGVTTVFDVVFGGSVEGFFSYSGAPVSRAVIDFRDDMAAQFAIDNLAYESEFFGVHRLAIESGDHADGLDFGNQSNVASIHAFKFEDLAGDGDYDVGVDLPLPGVSFVLSGRDNAGNSVFIVEASDENGHVNFAPLSPGNYRLSEALALLPPGVVPSTSTSIELQLPANVELVAFPGQANIPSGDPRTEVVLGSELMFGNVVLGAVRGLKFEDVEADGELGLFDRPLPGIEFVLTGVDNLGNAVEHTTRSGADGTFDFEGLYPGQYQVTETLPPGFIATAVPASTTVTIESGIFVPLAFGNAVLGSIHGLKYEDVDGNGQFFPDVDRPWPGVMIRLTGVDGLGNSVDLQTVTDEQGEFDFTGLVPSVPGQGQGTGYLLSEVVPPGSVPTTAPVIEVPLLSREELVAIPGQAGLGGPGSGGPGPGVPGRLFALAFGSNDIIEISPATGAELNRFAAPSPPDAFGIVGGLAFGGDRLWYTDGRGSLFELDPNTGAVLDNDAVDVASSGSDELGFVDGVVYMWLNNGDFLAFDPVTDIGVVVPTDLPSGLYPAMAGFAAEHALLVADANRNVHVVDPLTGDVLRSFPSTIGNVNGIAALGGEIFLATDIPQGRIGVVDPAGNLVRDITAPFYALALGGDMGSGGPVGPDPRVEIVVGSSLMFGNTVLGSIHGYKFEDTNANSFDDQEPRMEGVPIGLFRVEIGPIGIEVFVPVASTETDGDGEFDFVGLRPGYYIVTETPPPGTIPTTPLSRSIFVHSREELVALPGQAGLDPNDPDDLRVEVVVGSHLAFSNVRFGDITGQKFEDRDGDGEKDAGEPGLAGWEIVLSGTTASGEFVQLSTQTAGDDPNTPEDETGWYRFPSVAPGSYFVTEVQQPGWVMSLPAPALGGYLVSGGAAGLDFGNYHLGSIHGQKFEDRNANGTKDPNEPGVPGWLIVLSTHDAVGQPIEVEAWTDNDGRYEFAGLAPGDYVLTEQQRPDWTQSYPESGSYSLSLVSGDVIHDRDFGNFLPVALHGVKFEDRNGNGQFEWWNEPPLADVTFTLNGVDGQGNPVSLSQTTGPSGEFSFVGLVPGEYVVAEAVPSGFVPTTPPVRPFVLASGDIVVGPDLQFGNTVLGSIHGYKFEDLNGNGQDENEPRIEGVTIELIRLELDPLGNEVRLSLGTTQTDANGEYGFTGVYPGAYLVAEHPGSGWSPTTVREFFILVNSREEIVALPGQAGLDPNDPDELRHEVTVGPWLAFGNAELGSIHGLKYEDLNADGDRDVGEPALAGWEIVLQGYDGRGQFVNLSAVTMVDDPETPNDETGLYWFDGLLPGHYVVSEVQQIGWRQSEPQEAGYHFALQSGDNQLGADFGNYRAGVVAGEKFEDLDGDGTRDPNERGLSGWVIVLTDANQSTRTVVTDDAGAYEFLDVPPGEYVVTELPQDGWGQSFPASGLHAITVGSGEPVDGLDFGNFGFGGLYGFKFEDREADGDFDPGFDPPLEGISFVLAGVDGAGNVVTRTAQTDANGAFVFAGLRPGSYVVSEVLPQGSFATTSASYSTTVGSGEQFVAQPGPFGFVPGIVHFTDELAFGNARLGSIHGVKFEDVNGNGVRDFGEPGLAGVAIVLDANADSTADDTVVTNADGEYVFADLAPGVEYVVSEIAPEQSVQTTINPSRITLFSGQHYVADHAQFDELLAGGVPFGALHLDPHLGFGNAFLGSIHGVKFEDLDGDGQWDPNEPGLPGVAFELNGTDGLGRPVTRQAVSGANGEFAFEGLFPSVPGGVSSGYVVHELPVPGAMPTTNPVSPPFVLLSRQELVWEDGAADLVPNDPRYEVNVGGALVFGNFVFGAIHGYKFNDVDRSGADNSEPRVPGITIVLTGAGFDGTFGTADDTQQVTSTGGNGTFAFTGLGAGTYRVREVLPAGFEATTPEPADIVLASGQVWMAAAGQAPIGPHQRPEIEPTLALGNARQTGIRGRKFQDLDGNGHDNNGTEPGLGGMTIELWRDGGNGRADFGLTSAFGAPDDTFVRSVVSAPGTGAYRFDESVGTFHVREVLTAAQSPVFVPTMPTAGSYTVNVAAEGLRNGADFGNHHCSDRFEVDSGTYEVTAVRPGILTLELLGGGSFQVTGNGVAYVASGANVVVSATGQSAASRFDANRQRVDVNVVTPGTFRVTVSGANDSVLRVRNAVSFASGTLKIDGGLCGETIAVRDDDALATASDAKRVFLGVVSNAGSLNDGVAHTFDGVEYDAAVLNALFASQAITRIEINAGGGNDLVRVGTELTQPTILRGGDGDDAIRAGTGAATIQGDGGNDLLVGGAGADIIRGGTGNDSLLGLDGNDQLDGEAGNDDLSGGLGTDTLRGNVDNDRLAGDAGADRLVGDGGTDIAYRDATDTLVSAESVLTTNPLTPALNDLVDRVFFDRFVTDTDDDLLADTLDEILDLLV